jgi:hypothetical protein
MDKVVPIKKKHLCKECDTFFHDEEMMINHPCQIFKAMHENIRKHKMGFKWKIKLLFLSLDYKKIKITLGVFSIAIIFMAHFHYSFLESLFSNMALSFLISTLLRKSKQY